MSGEAVILPTSIMSALVAAFNPDKVRVYPETYLAAAGQALAIMFAVSWSLTLAFNSDVIDSNPLKDRIGYNNLCVGFDTPPAVWIAQVLFIPCAYLCYQFALYDWKRTSLIRERLTPTQILFSQATDIMFVISVSVFSLVFVVSPFVSHWAHSLAFIQYIIIRFLTVSANFYEHANVPPASKNYLKVYGVLSFLFPFALIVDYMYFDTAQDAGNTDVDAPFIPWWITAGLDYGWFACLALSQKFLPLGESLDFANVAPATEGSELRLRPQGGP